MTAIVILALVAVFIGLRLYSVLGERTGHEQPIVKPADAEADARIDPRTATTQATVAATASENDLAYLPTAGPGVRALLNGALKSSQGIFGLVSRSAPMRDHQR